MLIIVDPKVYLEAIHKGRTTKKVNLQTLPSPIRPCPEIGKTLPTPRTSEMSRNFKL